MEKPRIKRSFIHPGMWWCTSAFNIKPGVERHRNGYGKTMLEAYKAWQDWKMFTLK